VTLAAASGRTEVLTYLLSRLFHGMIDMEAKDENGHTALIVACRLHITTAAVELLLQNGADPRNNETTGQDLLELVHGNKAQKRRWILAARADPERARHLHNVRYMLERAPLPKETTTKTTKRIETGSTVTTIVTRTTTMPKPVVKMMGRARKRGRGEEAEEEEKKLVRVFGYVTGLRALEPAG